MRFSKKVIAISALSLITFLLLANWIVMIWLDNKLTHLLSEKNKTPYYFSYSDLKVSIWSGTIFVSEITILPKSAKKDSAVKTGIYGKIKNVDVRHFSIWNVLFNDKITARSITIETPEIEVYQKNEKSTNRSKSTRSSVVKPFQQIITVSDLYINRGSLKIMHSKSKVAILNASNINVKLQGILITDAVLKRPIPFSFEVYSFTCDSIYYKNNPFYHIAAHSIQTENSGISLKDFEMIPDVSRKQFVAQLPKEKDLYALKAASVEIKNMAAGFKNEKLFFDAGNVILNNISATIYRSKTPADDLSKKPLYNKLLRELPFAMNIDTLSIRNSLLVYEEALNFETGSGKLSFNKFNLLATNIQSGYGQKKMDDLKISITCLFMNIAPMKIDWKLNVLDKLDGFTIKGSILKFDTKKLGTFTKPYINIKQEGIFDEVHFNFTGNDVVSNGDFALKYHDLKVTLYQKKDPNKKSKIKSAIANLLVKNDSENETKTTNVSVKRIPEKSFYNFLWRNIAEGMKKILI